MSDRREAPGRAVVLGSEAILLLAAILWGAAFVAQKRAGSAGVTVLDITATRFLLAAGVLAPVVLWRRRRGRGTAKAARRRLWIGALVAGGAMFVATVLQQAGLLWTDSGVAGFITGLYVIFVPLIGLLLRIRIGWPVWVGAVLALAGLYLLSVHGRPEINPGDGLVLLCAVIWAAHVLIVGWSAPRVDAIEFSLIQFAVTGVLGSIALAATSVVATVVPGGPPGPPALPGLPFMEFMRAPWDLLYLGVVATSIAFTLQVVGQRHAPAAHAAIILSLEAVFAAIAGALVLDERFDRQSAVGAGLMFVGIIVAQVVRPGTPVPSGPPAHRT